MQSKIVPFDAVTAYNRERDHSRKLEAYLLRALTMMRLNADRLEARGVDVKALRTFIAEGAAL